MKDTISEWVPFILFTILLPHWQSSMGLAPPTLSCDMSLVDHTGNGDNTRHLLQGGPGSLGSGHTPCCGTIPGACSDVGLCNVLLYYEVTSTIDDILHNNKS